MVELRDDPHGLPEAPGPHASVLAVNGTTLYTEVRGEGPAILLIPGGAEDAEGWRPVAERLVGHTVVTYDRRGTLRSGREDWPGCGSAQHADDAAALIASLGLDEVVVLGGSSAGIVAVQLALRHPGRIDRVLAFEPGFFRVVPGGMRRQRLVAAAVRSHLEAHPGDWPGAYDAFVRVTAPDPAFGLDGSLAAGPSHAWHAERERLDAEPFVRDDVPILTAEHVDRAALGASPVDIRFAYGSRSTPMFRDIATRLAASCGKEPDVIEGVGHALYLDPDRAAAYVREWATWGTV
jgi:pimeloyl-ACP methyl ester carboxylesterase